MAGGIGYGVDLRRTPASSDAELTAFGTKKTIPSGYIVKHE